MSYTMAFNDDGTLDMTISVFGETQTESFTWSESSDGTSFSIDGVSGNISMASDGNSFSVTDMFDAYCQDPYTYEETSHTDSTSCYDADNDWVEATCSFMEYTKQ